MPDLPITAVDIAIVVVLLISGLLAVVRGFVQEVLAVGAWVGAIAAAIVAFPLARPFARDLIPHELAADAAAGLGVFVVILVVLSLVTRALARRVKDSALNALDRSLGFVFGLVRGGVLVCLAYIAVEWLVVPAQQPSWLRDARAMPLVEWGADQLKSLVPSEAREAGGDAAGEVRDRARDALETERRLRDIMSPEPKGTPPGDERGGYDRKERRDMERLLESGR
ncbi:MAG: CvpA family protein [Rhodospirillales bacterium]